MIDNIDLIKSLLTFDNEYDFYRLYIFQRSKDFEGEDKLGKQSVRTIKTYNISSLDYLDSKYEEIKGLCEFFKARAYIHLAANNHKDVGYEMISEIGKRLKEGHLDQSHLFDSIVGKLKFSTKRWIVDIDTKDETYYNTIEIIIKSKLAKGNKIIAKIPTKQGYHLITNPFDREKFVRNLQLINIEIPDIQPKNPTLLYLPESL